MAIKDPDAVLDYGLTWTAWLAGDTITASEWTEPDGISVDSDTHDDTSTTVWLSGGTVGQTYELTNHVTTAAGRQDDRTISITVQER